MCRPAQRDASWKAAGAAENSWRSLLLAFWSCAPFAKRSVLLPQVARRAGIWCHVDACLGGFVLPFARQLGHAVPAFDFAVPGVSSMSVDTHKFGMAHKARASRAAAQCCLLFGGVSAPPCKA